MRIIIFFEHHFLPILVFVCLAICLAGASCKPIAIDSSAFALESGNRTVFLGSDNCGLPINIGYMACAVERGSKVPNLRIIFMNPGEYAVSDCRLGIYVTGSVPGPMEVPIDLSNLKNQLDEDGFCLLKVETKERFPDNSDSSQFHEIHMGGTFFLEAFAPGYMPIPSKTSIGWCARVGRTTKGRAYLKTLDAEDCD